MTTGGMSLTQRLHRGRGLPPLATVSVLIFGFIATAYLSQPALLPPTAARQPSAGVGGGRRLLETSEYTNDTVEDAAENGQIFPPDVFTLRQRRQGAVVLHVLGVIYMGVALFILCNEFFVPSIDAIIEKWGISEERAGAIFMAAATGVPELVVSIIGVYVSSSYMRYMSIGTVVGSAIYNILLVSGMCMLLAKTVMKLSLWSLYRNVSLYSAMLVLLVIFFSDNRMYWYESFSLLSLYMMYYSVMKYDNVIKQFVSKHLNCCKGRVASTDHTVPKTEVPLEASGPENVRWDGKTEAGPDKQPPGAELTEVTSWATTTPAEPQPKRITVCKDTPINLSWPDTCGRRLLYIVVAPVIIPLWLTMPDTRTPRGKRFFVVAYVGSMVWMAVFGYFILWWTSVVGETLSIPPEVIGLVVLAFVNPDLFSCIIVARRGFGDMAVSTAMGRNVFDITCRLAIPWLLVAMSGVNPIFVDSGGMACSMLLLVMFLVLAIVGVACARGNMNKCHGVTSLVLYAVFVAVSFLFVYRIVMCPM